MKNMKTSAVTLLTVLFLVLALSVNSYSQELDAIGVVSAYQGTVEVTRGVETLGVTQGMEVALGDIFDTGADSKVKIVFVDDTLIALGEDTSFEITEFVFNPDERSSVSNITKGKMRSLINKFKGATSNVEYKTANAVAGVKGTTLYIDADEEIFAVREGEAFVRGILPGAKEVRLLDNQFTRIINGNPTDPQFITEGLWNEFLNNTDFPEQLLDLLSFYETYFPGSGLPGSPRGPGGLFLDPTQSNIPGVELPTVPPIDLTPGGGIENGVPVIIDIPGLQ